MSDSIGRSLSFSQNVKLFLRAPYRTYLRRVSTKISIYMLLYVLHYGGNHVSIPLLSSYIIATSRGIFLESSCKRVRLNFHFSRTISIFLGDILLSINGETVKNCRFSDTIDMMKSKSRPIVLVFTPGFTNEFEKNDFLKVY